MSDVLGTGLVLAGCLTAAGGYVLQKKGNVAWAAQLPALRRPIYCNPLWLAGLACMVTSALLVVASAPFLDQSKSAPLGAATLVFNTILSALVLGEKFLVLHLISTILVVAGAVIASSANAAPSAALTYAQIIGLFDGVAIGFSVVLAALGAGGALALRRITRAPRAEWSQLDATTLSLLAPALGGTCNGLVSYATKALTTAAGGGDASALSSPALYAFVVVLLAAVYGQVSFLNLGLAYFSAMQVVPVFQFLIVFSNSLCGIVYFSDMRSAHGQLAVFFLGAAICGAGILLLLLNKEEKAGGGGGARETLIPPQPAAGAAGEPGGAALAPEAAGGGGGGGGGGSGGSGSGSAAAPSIAGDLEASRAQSLAASKYSTPWPEPSGEPDAAHLTVEGGGAQVPWYLREVRSLLPGARS
jgi:hypothetical protein